ncbi:C2 domain-containing protein [Pilobolus umbonatus]|nr:C2 domain-containing protein [Pilobolus umbonatus]
MFTKYPAGVLHVAVIEGRKLHDEDLVGKGDPYVELWVDDDHKQKTKVISGTNDPVWNQNFTFPLPESRKHYLYIEVFDKDKVGKDDIGDTKIDLEEVFNGKVLDTWVKLPAKLGLTSHGEVHLHIRFVPE